MKEDKQFFRPSRIRIQKEGYRREKVDAIGRHFDNPNTKVVVLVGPSGAGKTEAVLRRDRIGRETDVFSPKNTLLGVLNDNGTIDLGIYIGIGKEKTEREIARIFKQSENPSKSGLIILDEFVPGCREHQMVAVTLFQQGYRLVLCQGGR